MRFKILALRMFLFIFITSSNRKAWGARGNDTDKLALLAIKAKIDDDPFQITTSWNDSVHFCRWRGVSCGRKHQRVTKLDLPSFKLKGHISPSIANLTFLRYIDLTNNSFQGEIPSQVNRLSRLQVFALGNNSLAGQIPPNLSFCSRLEIIYLNNNNFTGNIPFELGSLSRLTYFSVLGNNLVGEIPPHLGNLSSLRVLTVADNKLEGHVPGSLGQLRNLVSLSISSNRLSGKIPNSIYNLSRLVRLFMENNELEGNLPRDIGLTLSSIELFVIWGNKFSGAIPVSFANASNLHTLQLSLNNFFGGVPNIFGNLQRLNRLLLDFTNLGSGKPDDLEFFDSLANCSNLGLLQLVSSNFGGTFPTSIANFSTQLEILSIEGNSISGNIPNGIGNLKRLSRVYLDNNRLSGAIPATIGELHNLQELTLSGNRLSEEIPSSLGNLTSLLQLELQRNKLQGDIPSSIGKCRDLLFLDLSNNELNGIIPQGLFDLRALSMVVNLSRNHLVGSLPSEVGNLVKVDQLDISHNKLFDIIPQTLGDCTMLRRLYMDHNMFEGTIPDSLRLLRGIEEIDLSHNNLSGEIPAGIANLTFLSKLDLSFNDLAGELPTGGVFSNVSRISISGNNKLCGGLPQLLLQACSKKKSKKQSSFNRLVIAITVSVLCVLAISLALYFLFTWWFKKKRNQQTETSSANLFASVSYGNLLKATNGFSSENLIGQGSIGSVYKGILEPNRTAVAVKVFSLQKRGAPKSFASECETLRSIRHRNLVRIITACSSIDYQGNEFKALVYELMPNGSLEKLLHPSPQTANSTTPLSLSKRIDIAIDVASAVDYLHNHATIPIIHCDLKPSNILLDQDNIAHVGDFGLSRIVPQDNDQPSSSGLKGTIGYAAPEYGLGSKVSKEGDVYSFGILLLEMFTGKRPTDNDFGDGVNLNEYVSNVLPERAMEIVDQGIIPREETRKMKISECCVSVLKIGVMCSDESPKVRMKIDEALKELSAAKKLLL